MAKARRSWVDRICGIGKWIGTTVLTSEGAIERIDPSKWPPLLAPAAAWATAWAFLIIGTATAMILLAEASSRWWGKAREWKLIQFQLDQLSDTLFDGVQYQDMGANKVTLFRFKHFHLRLPSISFRPRRWFRGWWAGWLVQVCRSGHVTQNKRACFFAPDDSDSAEGVAGMAWRSRKAILVDNLPAINNSSGIQRIRTYSERTWVTEAWITKALKRTPNSSSILPRSMFGVAVESKKGRWGVLVIDSRETSLKTEEELVRLTSPICSNLAVLVEEV